MIDLTDKLEVFIITNGRSTFPYCLKSVEGQQNVKFKKTIIRDMKWIDANNEILKLCQTKYFLRVDDDMLLHPRAMEYMWSRVETQGDHIAVRVFLLWETYKNMVVKGIKVYSHGPTKEIGFKVNALGKIDGVFREKVEKSKYKMKTDKNVVGIHSCSTVDEHLKYALMRGEDKGKKFPKKEKNIRKFIGRNEKTLEEQYEMRDEFLYNLGKESQSIFYNFLGRK